MELLGPLHCRGEVQHNEGKWRAPHSITRRLGCLASESQGMAHNMQTGASTRTEAGAHVVPATPLHCVRLRYLLIERMGREHHGSHSSPTHRDVMRGSGQSHGSGCHPDRRHTQLMKCVLEIKGSPGCSQPPILGHALPGKSGLLPAMLPPPEASGPEPLTAWRTSALGPHDCRADNPRHPC